MNPQLKYLMVTFTSEGRVDRTYFDLGGLLDAIINEVISGREFEVYELPLELYAYHGED